MAICTKCGVIMNDADAQKHVCKPLNVPAVGTELRPTTSPVAVD